MRGANEGHLGGALHPPPQVNRWGLNRMSVLPKTFVSWYGDVREDAGRYKAKLNDRSRAY